MAIIATDLEFILSGGGANVDPNASLGGAISTQPAGVITSASLHNLFDVVSGAESSAGDVEYRCIYLNNKHGTLSLQGAKVWVDANTPSADTVIDISLGTSVINGIEQTVADEQTAPAGVAAFSAPISFAAGLVIGDIPAGQHMALWVRRTITAAAAAVNADNAILKFQGDTAA